MKNYCNLPSDAKIYFGSGGSDGIIAVVDNVAYKYFLLFVSIESSKNNIKQMLNDNKYEINVIKELTNKFIKPQLTQHIIKYYNYGICDKIPFNIFKMCQFFFDYLYIKKTAFSQSDMALKSQINLQGCKFLYK